MLAITSFIIHYPNQKTSGRTVQLRSNSGHPVVELVGWSVTGGFQTGAAGPTSASGTNIINVKIGTRMGFGGHSSLYVGYGGPVTSADWYNDIVRIEYRYSF
jgi:hypothetical protein